MSSDCPMHTPHSLGRLPYPSSHPGFLAAHPHLMGLLDPTLSHESSEPFLQYLPCVLWAWLQGDRAG